MKKLILLISTSLFLLTASFSFTSCKENSKAKTEIKSEVAEYQCPMHCEGDKTYDRPGNCPKCGMKLEKTGEKTHDHSKHNR
jgi:Cu2+-exporting ATPase